MKLATHKLPEGIESRFEFNAQEHDWLKEMALRLFKDGIQLQKGPDLTFSVTRIDPHFYVKGLLNQTLKLVCDRCTVDFELPQTVPFELALTRVAHHNPKKTITEELAEDDESGQDVIYFDQNELDIAPLIEEQIVLNRPFQAICKETCKGICQTCGFDLNSGACTCQNMRKNGKLAEILSPYKSN